MPSNFSKNKPHPSQTPAHKQPTGTNRVSGLNIGAEGTKRRVQEVKATQQAQRSKQLQVHRQQQQELDDNDRDSFTQNTSSTTTRTTKTTITTNDSSSIMKDTDDDDDDGDECSYKNTQALAQECFLGGEATATTPSFENSFEYYAEKVTNRFENICQSMEIDFLDVQSTDTNFHLGALLDYYIDNEDSFTSRGDDVRGIAPLNRFLKNIAGRGDDVACPFDVQRLHDKLLEARSNKRFTILDYSQQMNSDSSFRSRRVFVGVRKVLASDRAVDVAKDRHVEPTRYLLSDDDPKGHHGLLLGNDELTAHCHDNWKFSPSKALVLGGSSGSGKTVAALQAARSRHINNNNNNNNNDNNTPDVVIYLTPQDIFPPPNYRVDNDDGDDDDEGNCTINGRYSWPSSNGRTVLKELHQRYQQQQQQHEPSSRAKTKRNEFIIKTIVHTIRSTFVELKTDKKKRSDIGAGAGGVGDQNYKVFIILDEIGGDRLLVRVLRSAIRKLAAKLHKIFFGSSISVDDDEKFDELCRVNFIVSGTGLAVPDQLSPSGSESKTASSYQLDTHCPLALNEQSMRRFLHPEMMKKAPEVQHLLQLQSLLDSDSAEQVSSTQLLVLDLCKNARCAALFLIELDKWLGIPSSNPEETARHNVNKLRFSRSSGFFDAVLSSFLPLVVRNYVNRNGLQLFEHPENVLLCALAVVTFKIPLLPLVQSSTALSQWLHRDGLNHPDDCSLHDLLSVSGGVLVDHLFSSSGDDNNDGAVGDDDVDLFLSGTIGKISDGRYSLSNAHLAIIHIMFGIERKPPGWSGFETSTSDFCFLIATISPFFTEMKRALMKQCYNYNMKRCQVGMPVVKCLDEAEAHYDKNKNCQKTEDDKTPSTHHHPTISTLTPSAERKFKLWRKIIELDPLYSVKEALVFESFSDKSKSDDSSRDHLLLQVHQYLNNVKLVISSDVTFEEQFEKIETSFFNKCRRESSSKNSVFVMLSAEKEAFADVVVVGPGKVVLIQCKGCADSSSIKKVSVSEELLKMGLTDDESDSNNCKTAVRYLERLKRLAIRLATGKIIAEEYQHQQHPDSALTSDGEEESDSAASVTVHRSLLFALTGPREDRSIKKAKLKIKAFKEQGGDDDADVSGGYIVATNQPEGRGSNFLPSYSFQYKFSAPHHPVKSIIEK